MAYNSTTKKITPPVSIYDVQQCLGMSSGDLGTLIANGSINRWSRYKPVPDHRPGVMDEWDATNEKWKSSALWWTAPHFNSGSALGLGKTYDDGHKELLLHSEKEEGTVYYRPYGAKENRPATTYPDAPAYYRLTDFAHYWHGATPPMTGFAVTNANGKAPSAEATFYQGMELRLRCTVVKNDDALHIDEIGELASFRFGAILYSTAVDASGATVGTSYIYAFDSKQLGSYTSGGLIEVPITNAQLGGFIVAVPVGMREVGSKTQLVRLPMEPVYFAMTPDTTGASQPKWYYHFYVYKKSKQWKFDVYNHGNQADLSTPAFTVQVKTSSGANISNGTISVPKCTATGVGQLTWASSKGAFPTTNKLASGSPTNFDWSLADVFVPQTITAANVVSVEVHVLDNE